MAESLKEFDFVMIKPSRYDDDGYPLVWRRGLIPSNSLAALHGIAQDSVKQEALGPGTKLNLVTYDEITQHVVPERIIRDLKQRNARALIGLVGVQSNQFLRALDLARAFRAGGLPVVIGGFHVSGCLAMLSTIPSEIQEALDIGCSLFAGECEEGRLDQLLRDAHAGQLKPIYNYVKDLPSLENAPRPLLPADAIRKTSQAWSSFDLGRGCPFQCSFCTIINVQGRKSRFRTPDDLEAIIRENMAQGIKSFFITDDNIARNRRWEEFFDRLIELREKAGLKANLTIQVDTMCHRLPNFIDKAMRAGATRVFIGLENINPDNLVAAKKRQNKITEYRYMLQEWHNRGAFLFAGYILGFPGDTRESIRRDIEIIKRELPIDVLEIFYLTPLPGSEDHKKLLEAGAWMDSDLNKYNLHNRVSRHPKMSDADWDEAYHETWRQWFSDEHIETVARRHAARADGRPKKAVQYMMEFKLLYEIEGVHALEGGVVRRKRRKSRRSTLPLESPLLFYPRFALECATKGWHLWRTYRRLTAIGKRVAEDPNRLAYTDAAIQPVRDDELKTLDLFQETAGGTAEVAKKLAHQARQRSAEDFAKAHAEAAA